MNRNQIIKMLMNQWKTLIAEGTPPITINNMKGGNIRNYKIYGNTKQGAPLLPVEYQQVEYIESTGTQYIELNYKANQDTITEGKFQLRNYGNARAVFGSRDSSSTNAYGLNWGGSSPYHYYNTYYRGEITNKQTDYDEHIFKKDKGSLYMDGVLLSTNSYTSNFSNTYNVILFGMMHEGTPSYLSRTRIFYIKFKDANEELELYPCYRKSDDEVGMYDIINNVFYMNDGTGIFTKGRAVGATPDIPITIENVGDLVDDILDEHYGKYKIPFEVSNGTNSEIVNIYLNEPLRKVGTYSDYVDFENQKVVRNIGKYTGQDFTQYNSSNGYKAYRVQNVNAKVTGNGNFFCNWFSESEVFSSSNMTKECIQFSLLSNIYLALDENRNKNGLEFIYVKNVPTEENVSLPEILSYKGTSIYSINTNINSSSIYIKYKGR